MVMPTVPPPMSEMRFDLNRNGYYRGDVFIPDEQVRFEEERRAAEDLERSERLKYNQESLKAGEHGYIYAPYVPVMEIPEVREKVEQIKEALAEALTHNLFDETITNDRYRTIAD